MVPRQLALVFQPFRDVTSVVLEPPDVESDPLERLCNGALPDLRVVRLEEVPHLPGKEEEEVSSWQYNRRSGRLA